MSRRLHTLPSQLPTHLENVVSHLSNPRKFRDRIRLSPVYQINTIPLDNWCSFPWLCALSPKGVRGVAVSLASPDE